MSSFSWYLHDISKSEINIATFHDHNYLGDKVDVQASRKIKSQEKLSYRLTISHVHDHAAPTRLTKENLNSVIK